jgi:hypothetical protein
MLLHLNFRIARFPRLWVSPGRRCRCLVSLLRQTRSWAENLVVEENLRTSTLKKESEDLKDQLLDSTPKRQSNPVDSSTTHPEFSNPNTQVSSESSGASEGALEALHTAVASCHAPLAKGSFLVSASRLIRVAQLRLEAIGGERGKVITNPEP